MATTGKNGTIATASPPRDGRRGAQPQPLRREKTDRQKFLSGGIDLGRIEALWRQGEDTMFRVRWYCRPEDTELGRQVRQSLPPLPSFVNASGMQCADRHHWQCLQDIVAFGSTNTVSYSDSGETTHESFQNGFKRRQIRRASCCSYWHGVVQAWGCHFFLCKAPHVPVDVL